MLPKYFWIIIIPNYIDIYPHYLPVLLYSLFYRFILQIYFQSTPFWLCNPGQVFGFSVGKAGMAAAAYGAAA